jgi:hypothetical protein
MRRAAMTSRPSANNYLSDASIGADVNPADGAPSMRKPKKQRPLNDLSRSLTPLDVNHTLIAVEVMRDEAALVRELHSQLPTVLKAAE